jgi:hypothetical protein
MHHRSVNSTQRGADCTLLRGPHTHSASATRAHRGSTTMRNTELILDAHEVGVAPLGGWDAHALQCKGQQSTKQHSGRWTGGVCATSGAWGGCVQSLCVDRGDLSSSNFPGSLQPCRPQGRPPPPPTLHPSTHPREPAAPQTPIPQTAHGTGSVGRPCRNLRRSALPHGAPWLSAISTQQQADWGLALSKTPTALHPLVASATQLTACTHSYTKVS